MNGDRGVPENGNQANAPDSVERLLQIAGPRSNPPQWMESAVRAAAHEAWLAQRRTRATRRRIRWTAIAASVLIVGGLALQLGRGPGQVAPATFGIVAVSQGEVWVGDQADARTPVRTLSPGDALHVGDRVQTGSNGRISLLRQDGASVRLDRNSALYVEEFARLHLDSGAVYFDSGNAVPGTSGLEQAARTGDSAKESVVIVTRIGIARDLGTQFALRVTDATLRLRVREGRVALAQEASVFEASAGEALSLRPGGTASREPFSSHDASWGWAEALAPHFDIDGRPVIEYLRWVARETGRELQFRSGAVRDAARENRFYGTIQGFAPKDSLRPVLATTRFSFELTERAIVIDLPPADL